MIEPSWGFTFSTVSKTTQALDKLFRLHAPMLGVSLPSGTIP
jgi:hypothetical protein